MIDSDKLLILVESAELEKASTKENRIHYYVFFSKEAGIRFTYNFQILKSLYSTALHEDLKILEEGRYLETSTVLRLTDKGKDWISSLPREETEEMQEQIRKVIRQYVGADELALFREAYAKLTRGL